MAKDKEMDDEENENKKEMQKELEGEEKTAEVMDDEKYEAEVLEKDIASKFEDILKNIKVDVF